MRIDVHVKHTTPQPNALASEQQKEAVVGRIEKALKHVAGSVRDVEAIVEDETPGNGKFDGKCRITVHFDKGKPLTVEGRGESFADTLADSVKKIQNAAETISSKRNVKKRRVAHT